jgi:hypothetical protein
MKFKAKVLNTEEYIVGDSLVHDKSTNQYVIFKNGMEWIDGKEWSGDDWEAIDISSIIIEN